jgi:magnesium transporter
MTDNRASSPVEEQLAPAAQLLEALESVDESRARLIASTLTEDQIEHFFEMLDLQDSERLLELLGLEQFGDLLVRLEDEQAADVLEQIPVDLAADVLETIEPDDAADIFGEFDPGFSDPILIAMEPEDAEEMRELLAYPPDTAGGIMTPAFVSISPTLRADQAVLALRRVAEEAETINYVYVTDPLDHLLGVLSLHRLVLTKPDTLVRDLMYPNMVSVNALDDQEFAARTLIDNEFLAIPVVDEENRILGIITVDDVAEVIEEETTEDIERLGGSAPLNEPYLLATPSLLYRKRIVWLMLLFMAQFLTISIISSYEGLIAQFTILSVFIPMLIGTGGNIGSQTVSTLIRAVAIGEVTPRNAFRVVSKEMVTGIALGMSMAALMFIRAYFTKGSSSDIALVVAVAVFAISIWAATVGAILPLALTKLKIDPAVVSAPLISSLVDATGLLIYFSVAQFVLHIT